MKLKPIIIYVLSIVTLFYIIVSCSPKVQSAADTYVMEDCQ